MGLNIGNLVGNSEHLDNAEAVNLGGGQYAKRVVQVNSNGDEVGGLYTSITTGTKTVTTAGTAVQITATPTAIKGIWLSADMVAGIPVAVGDSGVVANVTGQKGILLTPGSPATFLPINDLSLLYVDSLTNGGKLCYAYVN